MLPHLSSFPVYVQKASKVIPNPGPFGYNDVNIFINNVKHESKQQPLKANLSKAVNISPRVVKCLRAYCRYTLQCATALCKLASDFQKDSYNDKEVGLEDECSQ